MGHDFCYLTARQAKLFEVTLRVMDWNGIPHNGQSTNVDAMTTHPVPKHKELYCAQSLADVNGYKLTVVKQWLSRLRDQGWKGTMVIVDDLLKPFKPLVQSRQVLGISLHGDLNANFPPYEGEDRESSWEGISQRLMEIHRQAVSADPSPYRVFALDPSSSSALLVVNKGEAGVGEFTLDKVPNYTFIPSGQGRDDSQPKQERLGFT